MKCFVVIIILILSAVKVSAQEDERMRRIYFQAEEEYNIGRFDKALALLQDSIKGVAQPLSSSVYRLCGLCYIALYDAKNAERYVKLLLKENPHYVPLRDPARFADFVEQVRNEVFMTVSTASSQAETVDEVPVPITLITEKMIKDCGAQSLQDVLCAYLPSTTPIGCNGTMNFAFRGVFGVTQEKMLVLVDGIRINSYSTNTGVADYSIGLDKIKQIEILRGPGSTLYGDIALSGVVNVITKNGDEIDGVQLTAGVGNYGQRRFGLLFGRKYNDLDISLNTSLYRSDGERYYYPAEDQEMALYPSPGYVSIGGYDDSPSYDLGVDMEWKHLRLKYMHSSSKCISQLSMRQTPYDYGRYAELQTIKPGLLWNYQQFALSYNRKFGKFSCSASGGYYVETPKDYSVLCDTVLEGEIMMSMVGEYQWVMDDEEGVSYFEMEDCMSGLFELVTSTTHNLRGSLTCLYSYGNANNGGTILLGGDYGWTRMSEYDDYLGGWFNTICNNQARNGSVMENFSDKEPAADMYLQFKYRWRNLIVNSGVRYDYKKHFTGDTVSVFSPRLSVIYLLKHFNAKFNYSKSFVDVPLSKRLKYNYLLSLEPEVLRSFQSTFSSDCYVKGLNVEVNLYNSKYEDLVSSIFGDTFAVNVDMKARGFEAVASYERKGLYINAFASRFKITDYRFFDDPTAPADVKEDLYSFGRDGKIFYVPHFTSGVTIGYSPWQFLRLSVNAKYYSDQIIHYDLIDYTTVDVKFIDYTSPDVLLVNSSLRINYKNFGIDFCINNLFDKRYYQGGVVRCPMRQKGRWMMLGVSCKF